MVALLLLEDKLGALHRFPGKVRSVCVFLILNGVVDGLMILIVILVLFF